MLNDYHIDTIGRLQKLRKFFFFAADDNDLASLFLSTINNKASGNTKGKNFILKLCRYFMLYIKS